MKGVRSRRKEPFSHLLLLATVAPLLGSSSSEGASSTPDAGHVVADSGTRTGADGSVIADATATDGASNVDGSSTDAGEDAATSFDAGPGQACMTHYLAP